jgi:hypothetical protein
MASWVKPLAVPGPPPGPCDAKAASAHAKPATIDAAAKAKCEIRCLVRDDVMIISWDGKFQKIRATAYAGFEKCLREDPVIQAAVAAEAKTSF